MVRIARQVDDETLEREPSIFTVINTSSPLRLDTPMLQGIMEYSARNQIVVMTPFTLAGAMAPVTLAGALAQQNAEALAGIAFTQVVRPGSPVVYGGFTSNVDMQSGAPHSAPRNTCAPRWSAANWPAATTCHIAAATFAPPTPLMPKPPTSRCSRCGVQSWAGSTC